MANDIDMWFDLDVMEKALKKDSERYDLLFRCYSARNIDNNIKLADKLKAKYIKKYGHWGNYY